MKYKLWYMAYILLIFSGCKNEQKLEGNYSVCLDRGYAEVYFKKDSMRMASDNKWIRLSEWRKIEIKNDTLHYDTFGEFREPWTGVIKYIQANEIQLYVLESNGNLSLKLLDEKVDFDRQKEFWNGFHNRANNVNCQ